MLLKQADALKKTSYEKSDFLSHLLFLHINSKEIEKEDLCTHVYCGWRRLTKF